MFLAGTALAQSPEGTLKVKPPEPPPAAAKAPEVAPPQGQPGEMDADGNYTIKHGDTLWDLSQQFLNNPWYWPKIWADNPSVENPHWIYPGNRLKISNKGAGLPGEVGPVAADDDSAAPPPDDGEEIRTKEPDEFSTGSVKHTGAFAKDSDLVTMGGSIPTDRAAGLVPHVRLTSIVTTRELEEEGTIIHSAEQRSLLGQFDKVYLSMKKLGDVKLGAHYTVFREGDRVIHPITNEPYGYRTYLLGGIDIIGKTGDEAIGIIGPTTADIARGDHVAIVGDMNKPLRETPNDTDLTATVVTTEIPGITLAGQNHVVFIDKGAKENVKEGNMFEVVQGGDGLDRLRLPNEPVEQPKGTVEVVAKLVVFNVTEHTAAAMVVKAIREVSVGDRVEMRKQKATSGGSGGDAR
jgi:LysM repeat protein